MPMMRSMALVQTQAGNDGGAFMRLQDVHFMTSTWGGRVYIPQTGDDVAGVTPCS